MAEGHASPAMRRGMAASPGEGPGVLLGMSPGALPSESSGAFRDESPTPAPSESPGASPAEATPSKARGETVASVPAGPTHMPPPPLLSLKEQRERLREGHIWGFRCKACGHERFSPMARCPECKGLDIATREFSRTGTVVSYTIQLIASGSYLNETPFAFAIIKLDDGPQVSGWIPWISRPDDMAVGQKVEYTPSYKPGMMFEKR